MTAKEKLREAVERMSEAEAVDALRYFTRHKPHDRVMELLDNAPEVDEPATKEEEAGLGESRAQAERGETIPLEELRRELT